MPRLKLPLILLAGRDRRGTSLPEEGQDFHLLSGYKAMELEIAGQPLIYRLLERVRACDAFDPIFVAGPAKVYESLRGQVEIIDTDSDFGGNIRTSLEAVMERGHEGQVCVMTSDILPEPDELRQALDDLERHQPCDYWIVECRERTPEGMGASGWKPKYPIRPEGEKDMVGTLPGHMFVADPRIIRLDLLYRLFDTAYRTRNRSHTFRRAVIVRTILATLVIKDLKRIFTLRMPNIIYTMLWNGLVLIKKVMLGGVDQRELEDRFQAIWVRTSHRKRHPDRRGRIMFHHGISLARDIDTEEEAKEWNRQLGDSPTIGDSPSTEDSPTIGDS